MDEIIMKFVEYLPLYVLFCVIPGIIAVKLRLLSLTRRDLVDLVILSIYAPIFEEFAFRGIPLFLFGIPGLIVGNLFWIIMHPFARSWSFREFVSGLPGAFLFYGSASIFYSILWINSDWMLALLFHAFHNFAVWLGRVMACREEFKYVHD